MHDLIGIVVPDRHAQHSKSAELTLLFFPLVGWERILINQVAITSALHIFKSRIENIIGSVILLCHGHSCTKAQSTMQLISRSHKYSG